MRCDAPAEELRREASPPPPGRRWRQGVLVLAVCLLGLFLDVRHGYVMAPDLSVEVGQIQKGQYRDWLPPMNVLLMSPLFKLFPPDWTTVYGSSGFDEPALGVYLVAVHALLWLGLFLISLHAGRSSDVRRWLVIALGYLLVWRYGQYFSGWLFQDTTFLAFVLLGLGLILNRRRLTRRWLRACVAALIVLVILVATGVRHNAPPLTLLLALVFVREAVPTTVRKQCALAALLWVVLLGANHGITYGLLKARREHISTYAIVADIVGVNHLRGVLELPDCLTEEMKRANLTPDDFRATFEATYRYSSNVDFLWWASRGETNPIKRVFAPAKNPAHLEELRQFWWRMVRTHPLRYAQFKGEVFAIEVFWESWGVEHLRRLRTVYVLAAATVVLALGLALRRRDEFAVLGYCLYGMALAYLLTFLVGSGGSVARFYMPSYALLWLSMIYGLGGRPAQGANPVALGSD